jgi:hypothetical protein
MNKYKKHYIVITVMCTCDIYKEKKTAKRYNEALFQRRRVFRVSHIRIDDNTL